MKFVHRRLPLVFLAMALVAGCATAPGSDPVVVRAEQTWRIGFDVVDSFVILEKQGTVPGLKSARVHAFAEKLRATTPSGKPYGRDVFDKLDAAILAYKSNRTAENKATIQTFLALAESLISSAQTAMKGGGL